MSTAINEETVLELTALLTGRTPSDCAPFAAMAVLELQGRLKEPDQPDSRLDYLAAAMAAWRSVLADGTREERELTPAGSLPRRTGQTGREGPALRFLEECLLACSSLLKDQGPFLFRQASRFSDEGEFPGKSSRSPDSSSKEEAGTPALPGDSSASGAGKGDDFYDPLP